MKSKILMVALIMTILVSAKTYANDCNACDAAACDPCAACSKSCDLFSGLKKLMASRPCQAGECNPCDGVVACNPCDDASNCDPCGACDDGCGTSCRKFTFGKRLRDLLASRNNGCDPCGPCDANGCKPCDEVCNPCDDADRCGACDDASCNGCNRKLSLKGLFKGFSFGKCNSGCSDPCGPCGEGDCNPCDNNSCNPCDDANCNACDASCGKKFGQLLDKPRRNVKKFFDGLFAKCNSCNPCDACGLGDCNPCDNTACNACDSCFNRSASQLPEAAPLR